MSTIHANVGLSILKMQKLAASPTLCTTLFTMAALIAIPFLTACNSFSKISSIDSSKASPSSSVSPQTTDSSSVTNPAPGSQNSTTGSTAGSTTGSTSGSTAGNAAASHSKTTVMAFGDSNTYGAVAQGYREALSNYMAANAVPIQFVGAQMDTRDAFTNNRHEGYSGWAADDLLNGKSGLMPMNSVSKYLPDYILLMAGTNDFLVKNQTVAQATQNFQNLINEIKRRSPKSKIIVATVFPIVDTAKSPRMGYPTINENISSYNNALKAMIPNGFSGGSVMLLDMNSFIDFDWLSDGVHADSLGYVAVAQAWYSVLAPEIATKTKVAQPACVASPSSRSYIMTSLRYFAAAYSIPNLTSDAVTFTTNVNTNIGTLITTNWACQDTINVANYVTSAVAYLQSK